MPAPKGNAFWLARASSGRKPKFKTPEDLWKACEEYFDWNRENPLFETKPFSYEGVVTLAEVPLMRAMTIDAMTLFLDISFQNWSELRKKEGFSEVCTRAEKIIRSQKFEGAACNLLNASIIARDLGLRDDKVIALTTSLEDLITGDFEE